MLEGHRQFQKPHQELSHLLDELRGEIRNHRNEMDKSSEKNKAFKERCHHKFQRAHQILSKKRLPLLKKILIKVTEVMLFFSFQILPALIPGNPGQIKLLSNAHHQSLRLLTAQRHRPKEQRTSTNIPIIPPVQRLR